MSNGRLDPHPRCWNSQREPDYLVKDGYVLRGSVLVQLVRFHKDDSTKGCQFDGRAQDPRCDGCLK